jgi:hypothetical protein
MHRDANWVSDLRWLTGLAIDGGASLINWSVERLLAASIEIKVSRETECHRLDESHKPTASAYKVPKIDLFDRKLRLNCHRTSAPAGQIYDFQVA